MATTKHTTNLPFCLLFLSLFLLPALLNIIPGANAVSPDIPYELQMNLMYSPPAKQSHQFQRLGSEDGGEYLKNWKKKSSKKRGASRRFLIGSTAPICTYNECRGCKYRCRAEQIPVDANDPINSAYHYRCVCHR
ncbi:hypothetical protein H6P81_014066 [Aristolochia fimbriata]|uniref:Stomagen C-terminal domain-containing protein n=1 Tax=Aristolochia fimbriata TaxID=158543 RepID=A0AAV7EGG3_ARIFI|nr:hypothetical protein H6P81_014066 [Aristolochia fimbriata]